MIVHVTYRASPCDSSVRVQCLHNIEQIIRISKGWCAETIFQDSSGTQAKINEHDILKLEIFPS